MPGTCGRLHALEGQESSIVCALLLREKSSGAYHASRIPLGFCFVLGGESNVKVSLDQIFESSHIHEIEISFHL